MIYLAKCAAFYHLSNGKYIHVRLYLNEENKKGI